MTDTAKIQQKPVKNPGVRFVLSNYFGAWDPPLSVVDVFSAVLLEKTDFPSPIMYQMQTVSWLEVGLCVLFPLCMLGFCLDWTCAGLVHAVPVSVSPPACQFCCGWEMLFSWSHPSPRDTLVFLSHLLHRSLDLEGRGLIKASDIRLSVPSSLGHCTLSGGGFCVNYHLLWDEAVLMKVRQCTNLCVEELGVIRSHFITMFTLQNYN